MVANVQERTPDFIMKYTRCSDFKNETVFQNANPLNLQT